MQRMTQSTPKRIAQQNRTLFIIDSSVWPHLRPTGAGRGEQSLILACHLVLQIFSAHPQQQRHFPWPGLTPRGLLPPLPRGRQAFSCHIKNAFESISWETKNCDWQIDRREKDRIIKGRLRPRSLMCVSVRVWTDTNVRVRESHGSSYEPARSSAVRSDSCPVAKMKICKTIAFEDKSARDTNDLCYSARRMPTIQKLIIDECVWRSRLHHDLLTSNIDRFSINSRSIFCVKIQLEQLYVCSVLEDFTTSDSCKVQDISSTCVFSCRRCKRVRPSRWVCSTVVIPYMLTMVLQLLDCDRIEKPLVSELQFSMTH